MRFVKWYQKWFVGALLLIASGVVFAWTLPPRVSWIPAELKPDSIAPGVSVSYALTLKHTGFLPVPATKQLRIFVEGDIIPFITVSQPKFPPVFRRGNKVAVTVAIAVPSEMPLSVKTGALVLKRILPNGKVKDVWRSDELPVELTFSSFHIPPDPDREEDQATILGVDQDEDGVPDRANRWIGFAAPDSEKLRTALTLSAKAQQDFFKDYLAHLGEDPEDEVVRARVLKLAYVGDRADNCLLYVQGAHGSFTIPGMREKRFAAIAQWREMRALFKDTKNRMDALTTSERPLVATGLEKEVITDEQYKQECLDLGFDPDILPN